MPCPLRKTIVSLANLPATLARVCPATASDCRREGVLILLVLGTVWHLTLYKASVEEGSADANHSARSAHDHEYAHVSQSNEERRLVTS